MNNIMTLNRANVDFKIGGKMFYLNHGAMGDVRIRIWEKCKIQLKTVAAGLNVVEDMGVIYKLSSNGNDVIGALANIRDRAQVYLKVLNEFGSDVDSLIDGYYDTIWRMFSMIMITEGEDMSKAPEEMLHIKIEHWKKSGVTLDDAFFFVKQYLELSKPK